MFLKKPLGFIFLLQHFWRMLGQLGQTGQLLAWSWVMDCC